MRGAGGCGLRVAVVLLLAACATKPVVKPLDLKITNGRILDGTGAPWFRGDIGIRGDTIVAVGDLHDAAAVATLDARDEIVAPGFIDLLGWSHDNVFVDPHCEPKVRQGVTTEVIGEGFSPAPSNAPNARWRTLADYFAALQKNGSALNFAALAGASNAREMVIGNVNRPPTAAEMQQMEAIVDHAMQDGAIGLSTSLIYLPAMYSTTDEIISLAKIAAKYGGVYFTHMRDESDRIDMGLDEAFRIGREAHIPVNIWHLKVGGRANWGRMPHVIERISAARAEGLDVAANVYPYVASSTSLSTLAPDWALEGGYGEFVKRLGDPRVAEGLAAQIAKRGEHAIYVTRIPNPALAMYEKKFLEEIAAAMGVTPLEALTRVFAQSPSSPSVIFFSMSEPDVQFALKQPFVSVGSDAGSPTAAQRAQGVAVHPRAYGTFARVAGRYVRDEPLFTLDEAVRKMTSQAADRASLHDRGILRPGMKADVIVFDPAKIADVATFEDPHRMAVGVLDVIVNGVPVLREGSMTPALPGRVLRRRP